jgi:hypothetical protein
VALNNLAIDEVNQIIYISDSGPISMRFSTKEVLLGHEQGSILSYNLVTKETRLILDKIAFANGIVYQQQTNSIIYSELGRYKLWKLDLNTGRKTVLMENMFGIADNLKLSHDTGDLLVGIVTVRDKMRDFIHDKPLIRKVLLFLPEKVAYGIAPKTAMGLRVDPYTGGIKEYMFGAPSKTSFITSVIERNGKIYYSSLRKPTILVLDRNRKASSASETVESSEL